MSGKMQYTDLKTKREENSAKVEPNGVKHDHVSGSQTNSCLTPLTGSNYSDAGERKNCMCLKVTQDPQCMMWVLRKLSTLPEY